MTVTGHKKKNRKSVGGYCVKLNGGVVAYKTKKHSTVALSSAEAEYITVSLCLQKVQEVLHLLDFLGFEVQKPVQVHVDNQAVIKSYKNDAVTLKLKHMDLKYHYTKDLVKKGLVELKYVSSRENVADQLTKVQPTALYLQQRAGLVA